LNRESIMEQLKVTISNHFKRVKTEFINESDRLYEDVGIDSLLLLQLIVYIEEDFEVVIPVHDIDPTSFVTVQSLIDFIENLVKLKEID